LLFILKKKKKNYTKTKPKTKQNKKKTKTKKKHEPKYVETSFVLQFWLHGFVFLNKQQRDSVVVTFGHEGMNCWTG